MKPSSLCVLPFRNIIIVTINLDQEKITVVLTTVIAFCLDAMGTRAIIGKLFDFGIDQKISVGHFAACIVNQGEMHFVLLNDLVELLSSPSYRS